ncbi:MAG: hypothetical protein C0399_09560 [Syntrophus sp. (in: bacteria)]|nr:hypothetical protein [Syntrophus sp. (in: bacteria)]
MKKYYLLIIFALIVLSACTTMPERFKTTPSIDKEMDEGLHRFSGYDIESEDVDGFILETCYISYSFASSAESNIPEAKTYFVKVAHMLAKEKNKPIEPIIKSMLNTNTTRNELDGRNTSFVSGRVKYAR